VSWNKNLPDGGKSLKLGDDDIRANMDHLEDSLAREHEFPGTYGVNAGRHKLPVGALADRAAVASPPDGMLFGRNEFPVLDMRQAGAWVSMLGQATGTRAQRAALANVPDGFVWLDQDSYVPSFRQGGAWRQPGPVSLLADTSTDPTEFDEAAWTVCKATGGLVDFEHALALPTGSEAYGVFACFGTTLGCLGPGVRGAAVRLERKVGGGAYAVVRDFVIDIPENRSEYVSGFVPLDAWVAGGQTVTVRLSGRTNKGAGAANAKFAYADNAPTGATVSTYLGLLAFAMRT
jgi:hypothetical protein